MRRYPEDIKYKINLFHLSLQMGILATAESVLPGLPADLQPGATTLLAIAKEDYDTAITQYTSLLESQQNLTYTNNLALTYLYTANVQSAIAALEPVLRDERKKATANTPPNPIVATAFVRRGGRG